MVKVGHSLVRFDRDGRRNSLRPQFAVGKAQKEAEKGRELVRCLSNSFTRFVLYIAEWWSVGRNFALSRGYRLDLRGSASQVWLAVVVFLGLRTSGISDKFDSRGASDGDCEYLVSFFVRRRGLCESIMQIMEKERDDGFCLPSSRIQIMPKESRHACAALEVRFANCQLSASSSCNF